MDRQRAIVPNDLMHVVMPRSPQFLSSFSFLLHVRLSMFCQDRYSVVKRSVTRRAMRDYGRYLRTSFITLRSVFPTQTTTGTGIAGK
jgi:hypothetical protein